MFLRRVGWYVRCLRHAKWTNASMPFKCQVSGSWRQPCSSRNQEQPGSDACHEINVAFTIPYSHVTINPSMGVVPRYTIHPPRRNQ